MSLSNQSYCRLCAKLKPIEKLTNFVLNEEEQYIEKLSRINAPIDTFDEKLPNTVCFVCVASLEQAFDFVLRVGKAQEVLRDICIEQKERKDEENFNQDIGDEISIKAESEIIQDTPISKTESKHEELPSGSWLDYTWMCGICDTQFPDLLSLQEHSFSCHNICNSYRCTDCNKRIYTLDKFIKHVSTHRKYLRNSCYNCFKTYKNIISLKRHKKSYVTSDFVCRGCNMSFKSDDELKQHQDTFLSTRIVRLIPDNLKQTGLTCNICGMKAKSKGTLTNHLLTHTNRTRNHVCEICGKTCLRKYDLNIHMLKHTEVRSYKCEICNATFKTDYYLRIHYSLHENVKPFTCKICGKQFRLLKQVNFHQIVHSGTCPYKCEVCGKGFKYKSKLKVHERQHTGLMPYSCESCNRSFTDWSNYSKHMKGMHNIDIRKRKVIKTNVPAELKQIKKPGRPKSNRGKEDTLSNI